jgi:hypothetical protein
VGIQWKVRSQGVVLEFHTLATLQGWMGEGRVEAADQVSYNGRKWTAIGEIKELSAYFADVHRRASRGEISLFDESFGEEGEEDDSDAPTTIVGRGSSLASEISDMLREAATPRPTEQRSELTRTLSEADSDPDASGAGVLLADQQLPSAPPTFQRGSSLPPVEHAPAKAAGKPTQPEPTPAPISEPRPAAAIPSAPEPPKPQGEPARPVAARGSQVAQVPDGGGIGPAMIGGAVVVLLLVVLATLWAGGLIGGHAPPRDLATQVDAAP